VVVSGESTLDPGHALNEPRNRGRAGTKFGLRHRRGADRPAACAPRNGCPGLRSDHARALRCIAAAAGPPFAGQDDRLPRRPLHDTCMGTMGASITVAARATLGQLESMGAIAGEPAASTGRSARPRPVGALDFGAGTRESGRTPPSRGPDPPPQACGPGRTAPGGAAPAAPAGRDVRPTTGRTLAPVGPGWCRSRPAATAGTGHTTAPVGDRVRGTGAGRSADQPAGANGRDRTRRDPVGDRGRGTGAGRPAGRRERPGPDTRRPRSVTGAGERSAGRRANRCRGAPR
jgi:hypothetical protein